jgi:lipopolysaccharide transport system permease protein
MLSTTDQINRLHDPSTVGLSNMHSETHAHYEVRIRPSQSWLNLDIRGLIEFRDLLFLLVRRDFVIKYKQTILGPFWFFLQPLLTTVVFTVIFNRVGRLPTDGLPPMLFYLGGLTIWSYFSQNLNATSNTLGNNAYLFEKVYFPRLIIPLATTCSNLFAFAIQLASMIGFMIFFKFQGASFDPKVGEALLVVPLLILQTGVLSLGIGLCCSALTAKYRDLVHLIAFILQAWLYATPIIYPASNIPIQYRWLILANPVAPIVENFRNVLLGTSSITLLETGSSAVISLLVLAAGLLLFRRAERTFVDSV